MIKVVNNTVYLSNQDYLTLTGIWGAFRSDLDYCVELLEYSEKHYEFLSLEGYFSTKIDTNLKKEDYKTIFDLVFNQNKYIIEADYINDVRVIGKVKNTEDGFYIIIDTGKREIVGRLLKFEHFEENTLIEAIGYLAQNSPTENIFYIEKITKL